MSDGPARILIIETSGSVGQIALARSTDIMSVRRLEEARRHARDLVPHVRDMLQEQGWQARDVDSVFVSRGPGSYTGLRVGIISAMTFAYATGCRVLGIDTFAAIALQAAPEADTVDVIADAQQERVYVQRYRCSTGGPPSPQSPLRIASLADWLAERPPEGFATGPGVRAYRTAITDHVVAEHLWDPQPESVLRLGLERIKAGEHDDLYKLEPLYLRPSGAEEKWATLRRRS